MMLLEKQINIVNSYENVNNLLTSNIGKTLICRCLQSILSIAMEKIIYYVDKIGNNPVNN